MLSPRTMLLLAFATIECSVVFAATAVQDSTIPANHRCTAATCAFTDEMFKHAVALNAGTSALYLYWSLSQDSDEIAIGIDAHDTHGWVAVGISANGGMMGADIWRLSKDSGGQLVLEDMFVEDWVTPRRDVEQNLKLMGAEQGNGRTSFWFTRKVRPCDGGGMRWGTNWTSEDFDILGVGDDSNTDVSMIWATGSTHAFHYHGNADTHRGKYLHHRWQPPAGSGCASGSASGLTTHRLVNEPFEVDPTGITTKTVQSYWLAPPGTWVLVDIRKVRDPAWKPWHHHTLLYACTKAPTARPTPGVRVRQDGCQEILFSPSGPYIPDGAPKLGVLIGDDTDIKGFRMEVHYDGMWTMHGTTTDPGVGYLIDLAPNDGSYTPIGSISTGTLSLALPSLLPRGDNRLHMWGSCTIPNDVPADGLTVLYNTFHMHLQGRQMWVTHIAGPAWGTEEGKELSEVGRHNYYDWNFQFAGGFPPQGKRLFAGDTLIVHCRYDSSNNVNRAKHGGLDLQPNVTTTFGEGTMDEMCFDFITYFPRLPSLATCFGRSGYGNRGHVADDAALATNAALSAQFDAQICPEMAPCANAAIAQCFRSPIIGGTFCDAATGVTSCPGPVSTCSKCFPHSECGGVPEEIPYTPRTQTPRMCVANESASEAAGLKTLTYWSNLQTQQATPTATNCNHLTGKSEGEDNQTLVIVLSVVAAVAVLGSLYCICIMRRRKQDICWLYAMFVGVQREEREEGKIVHVQQLGVESA